jgi:hypothetical protein
MQLLISRIVWACQLSEEEVSIGPYALGSSRKKLAMLHDQVLSDKKTEVPKNIIPIAHYSSPKKRSIYLTLASEFLQEAIAVLKFFESLLSQKSPKYGTIHHIEAD